MIAVTLLSAANAHADHKSDQTITWYGYHQPPAQIFEGPQKGKGYVDRMLELLTNALPDYQHELYPASLGRVQYDLKAGKNVCFAAMMVTPQRKEYVHFSQASMLTPNNHITMKKSLAKDLGLYDQVSLQWLRLQSLQLGIITGRAYGSELDEIISAKSENLISRPDDSNEGLYHMLMKDRIHYVINYPYEASRALTALGSDAEFVNLKITEVDDFVLGSVGCAKTPWGEQVIADIDRALGELKPTSAYYQALSDWLPTDIRNDDYDKFYQQQFIQHLATPGLSK